MKTHQQKKCGILGIGNLLLSDESFGIHVIRYMQTHYHFPDSVALLDGGTAGIYMAPFLETHDPVFVIDVIDLADASPGSLYTFTDNDARNGSMQLRMSPHQLGILEILDICRLREVGPERVEFFCVVPESITTGLELSDCVASQVAPLANLINERLETMGLTVTENRNERHA